MLQYGEPGKYSKWKKLVTKTTYYMIRFIWNIQNKQLNRNRKYISDSWGLEDEDSFGDDKKCSNLDYVTIAQSCEYTKNHFTINFKQVKYFIWKLCINIAFKNNNPTI